MITTEKIIAKIKEDIDHYQEMAKMKAFSEDMHGESLYISKVLALGKIILYIQEQEAKQLFQQQC